jgi:hypothetical protein
LHSTDHEVVAFTTATLLNEHRSNAKTAIADMTIVDAAHNAVALLPEELPAESGDLQHVVRAVDDAIKYSGVEFAEGSAPTSAAIRTRALNFKKLLSQVCQHYTKGGRGGGERGEGGRRDLLSIC